MNKRFDTSSYPEWRTTPELCQAQRDDWRSFSDALLVEVSIEKVVYIAFDEPGDAEICPHGHYVNHQRVGHAEYVDYLVGVMREFPMRPALGYFIDGLYHANDGNHRICAAVKLGIKKIPMLVRQP